MNYNGENWEIGDTLICLTVPDVRANLLGHSRTDSWLIPESLRGQVTFEGRYRVPPGFVLLRGLTAHGRIKPGDVICGNPKEWTKLLPPAIEKHVHQEKPVENTGEEELLKAA